MVQSSRTPVVDMTACDTETDHDSDNSAPADAPPPRVWNEASVEESDTDSLELDGESDTVSLPGSVVPLEEEVVDSGPTNFTQHRREMSAAFRELDACELRPLFECRAHVMKTVPFFLRGGFRAALRVALEEISSGQERGDEQKQERGWKLFFLLPRMLLGRPCRGGLVPRKKLEARFQMFFSGQWKLLIDDSTDVSSQAASARIRKRRRQINNSQVARAENLAMIGELSAARQALESNGLAPGNRNTLNELRNRERRPPTAREPLPPEVASRVPERPFDLDEEVFCRNLRSARRGAAPGPSGMTCEHLQPILESDRDTGLLCHVAMLVARGCVPPMALQVNANGTPHSSEETTRWGQRDCGQRCVSTGHCKDNRETVCSGRRESNSPFPVRVEDARRLRVRVARVADTH